MHIGLPKHFIQSVTRHDARKTAMDFRPLRLERRRTDHPSRDARRRQLNLRHARQVHGAHGGDHIGQRTRRKILQRKF